MHRPRRRPQLHLLLILFLVACTSASEPPPIERAETTKTTTIAPVVITLPTVPPAPSITAPPPASISRTVRTAEQRCGEAVVAVNAAGLHIAAGFEFRCPALALDENGHPHRGITCWYWPGKCRPCGCYVEINVDRIGSSDALLAFVVAHEICHTIELTETMTTSEASADACAHAHGF